MRLRARGGHVWACRGVGIRQGFCAGTLDGGSVCRQGSGDAAQFCRADLQGEGGGFAGDLRGGVVDGVEDFLDRGSMHPEELRQDARVHRREICLGGGQGIGQLAQDSRRPARSPAGRFLSWSSTRPRFPRASRYESVCSYLGPRVKMLHAGASGGRGGLWPSASLPPLLAEAPFPSAT